MQYCDLHCDTLTVCCDNGLHLKNCGLQTDIKKLISSACSVQCFAIFTQDKTEEDFLSYVEFFKREMLSLRDNAAPILHKGDIGKILQSNRLACMLTCENLGFLHGNAEGVQILSDWGIKMASLVWNTANEFAYPNMIFKNAVPDFGKREQRGLTPAGKTAVEVMNSLGIFADVSHLSDGGVKDILEISTLPVIASHSNSFEVCPVCRNLTDWQIKGIADSGGIIGVNFCRDFLGSDDTFAGVLAHAKHIIDVGGENCIAFGSDFDGIHAPKKLETCGNMPELLDFLQTNLGSRITEKFAFGNFLRVFG